MTGKQETARAGPAPNWSARVEAGADLLCIDSSDGYSVWQKKTLEFARGKYGDQVHVGAGNVVDGRAFRYLAEAGAAFVKVGIGGGRRAR